MSNLDTSIRRYAEDENGDYIEICSCLNPNRFLKFDINSKNYQGTCGCNKEYPCARLQINKHKLILLRRRQRFLEPYFAHKKKNPKIRKNPNDQTIDQFFAE